jgi:hypothetical protein
VDAEILHPLIVARIWRSARARPITQRALSLR